MSKESLNQSHQGRTVNVQAQPAGGLSWQGYTSDTTDDERDLDVYVQAAGGVQPPANLVCQILWWKGEAQFRSPLMPVRTANLKPFTVSARKVQVSFQLTASVAFASGQTFPVSVSIAPGSGTYKGPGGSFSQWVQQPVPPGAMADHYQMTSAAGTVFGTSVHMFAFPAANATLWLLLVDKVGAPAAGDAPVPGGRSTAMTAAQPDAYFDSPGGALEFGNGIVAALSAQPDKYVAPGAGGQCTVDILNGG
jgi:hypothetical protein